MVTLLSDLLSDQSRWVTTRAMSYLLELHGDGLTKWPERKLVSDLLSLHGDLTKLLSNLLSDQSVTWYMVHGELLLWPEQVT